MVLFQQKQNHQSNFQLFARLTELSPANYSAFLKIDENYIISSSPELFLKAKNNRILSRPIKGTAPRDKDLKQDEKNKLNLKSIHIQIKNNNIYLQITTLKYNSSKININLKNNIIFKTKLLET